MKHAYLILAHQDFELLACLLRALDDPRNDIFIHIDKKVNDLPAFSLQDSELYFLDDRIDVRWGDVSVVEAELLLFEAASRQGHYSYYHLLSGVDFPLKSADQIHAFCALHAGKQFIGFSKGDQRVQLERKVQRYHLFPRHFRSSGSTADLFRKALRFLFLRIQIVLGIRRNKDIDFKKGTQWVSLTHDFVALLLSQKLAILKQYRNTFCADEIFIQTACWNSTFRSAIYNVEDEAEGSQRMIRWQDNQIYDWGIADMEELERSNLLFARKFNAGQIAVVQALAQTFI